jgi:four helix bundle protein
VPVLGAGAGRCVRCGTHLAALRRMVAKRYEELEAWQLANDLKRRVYELFRSTKARFNRLFSDQLTESAASAPSNLAEGFAAYRHPEFAKHTRIAKSSLTETHNHLGDGVDRGYWTAEKVEPIRQLAERAIGACVGLLHHLETTDAPGTRARTARGTRTTFSEGERATHVRPKRNDSGT